MRLAILLCLALVLAIGAVYGQVYGHDFLNYDDPAYVTENGQVQQGLTGASVRWAFTTTAEANWHPLTWLSLQLDYQLWGLKASGYHLTSLLLHCASSLLLFGVLWRMTGAVWASAAVAALFAVHPLHVESVAWVAERKDVLSTLFWMLTLWAYVWYVESPGLGRYLLLLLAFALGLLAKPMLVTLPCVLLLLDYWPLGRWPSRAGPRAVSLRRLVGEKLVLFALAAASCVITAIVQRQGGTVVALDDLPFPLRLGNAVASYLGYIGHMLWPANLAVFYPHPREQLSLAKVLAAGALLGGISVAAYRLRRRQPYLLVGWLWYVGTLVPVVGLVQVGSQAMADRYTYVPLIGLFIMLAWGVPALLRTRWGFGTAVLASGTALVLAVCMVTTWGQVDYWRDSVTLWEHALSATDKNFITHYHLGGAYSRQGQLDRAVQQFEASLRLNPQFAGAHNDLGAALVRQGKWEQARQHFDAALKIDPDYFPAHRSLGVVLAEHGKVEEALLHDRAALRLRPDDGETHLNLGLALARQGKVDEAVPHYRAAVEGNPNSADARYNLGVALARQRHWEEARDQFVAALRIDPNHFRAHHQLGEVLGTLGQRGDAVASCRRAVELQPSGVLFRASLAFALEEAGRKEDAAEEYRRAFRIDPNWPQAACQAAWVLATSPDSGFRDGARAVRLAQQACQATGDEQPALLDALAAAYAEAGQFDQAVAVARQALARAASSDPGRTRQLEDRLHLYESRAPYRDPGGAQALGAIGGS
jgi:tetratricopeptide (TPR) repeat protein